MTISVIQTKSLIRVVGAGDQTRSFDALPVAGRTVIVGVANYDGGSPTAQPTITDNQGVGNVYTAFYTQTESGANQRVTLYSCTAIGATSGTFTITVDFVNGGNYAEIGMIEVSESVTVDITATANTHSSGVTTITGTTLANADELVVVLYIEDSSGNGSQTISAATGYTNVYMEADSSQYVASLMAYKVVATTTAPVATITSTNFSLTLTAVRGIMATFKGAGGGGGSSIVPIAMAQYRQRKAA